MIYFNLFWGKMILLYSYDYMEISDQNNFTFGKYCESEAGRILEVIGDYVVITFHSDSLDERRGFSLLFTAVLPSVYKKCSCSPS